MLDSLALDPATSPNDLRNGLSMYATFDQLPLIPGFTACQCAYVVVAKKSKKQSLI
ncbi:hypothetical protein VUJ49_19825 [Pseudomonas berkeleyensis]|uniref:Uncharacterized protein n=1 Tax=Pseudomonas berkeleyensis TaxID=2726956 RepID=A0A7G5DGX4_9PSED|nr:hypothetical protein [Pseudomonas berkeleyensis]QMV60999.1 hypothetical protein HS968_19730 [Pseudomonas berkeleyensis]WSO37687.1 hypothetical protein VUJ49_19825 [Pseudomonas berkeleyensis]